MIARLKQIQLVRWVDSLNVSPPITNLVEEMKNGLLLCRILERLQPDCSFVGLNKKPRSTTSCVANLERGLAIVWQRGGVRIKNMPTAQELCDGKKDRAFYLIGEIFDAYVLRDIRLHLRDILNWFDSLLLSYPISFPEDILSAKSPELSRVLGDGVILACLCHVFAATVPLERMYLSPQNAQERHWNIQLLFDILVSVEIPVFITVDEWLTELDEDFLLFQAGILFEELRERDAIARDEDELQRLKFIDHERESQKKQKLAEQAKLSALGLEDRSAERLSQYLQEHQTASPNTNTNTATNGDTPTKSPQSPSVHAVLSQNTSLLRKMSPLKPAGLDDSPKGDQAKNKNKTIIMKSDNNETVANNDDDQSDSLLQAPGAEVLSPLSASLLKELSVTDRQRVMKWMKIKAELEKERQEKQKELESAKSASPLRNELDRQSGGKIVFTTARDSMPSYRLSVREELLLMSQEDSASRK
jgi:hypothetical protein